MKSKVSQYNETVDEIHWNMLDNYDMNNRTNQIIMRRIAINLAEIADQLAEMNGYLGRKERR